MSVLVKVGSRLCLSLGITFVVLSLTTLQGFSDPARQPLDGPQPPGAVRLTVGGYHSCVLKSDDSVQCWGRNFSGQSTPPVGLAAIQVSAGQNHTCAVRDDATVACWGYNGDGQRTVPAGLLATNVAAGVAHSCAVEIDGAVVCWGSDEHGKSTPPVGLANVVKVVAGTDHSCALKTDATVACWGSNFNDQLNIPGGLVADDLSGRYLHSCALRADATAACWGYFRIAAMPSGVTAAQISAGGTHTCVVQLDATVRCWGFDALPLPEASQDYGQTVVPAGLESVVAVGAGGFHTCALRSDGGVECWGLNDTNQTDVPDELAGDLAAPVVSCESPDGLWHPSNVNLACTATDAGSGLADAADATFLLATSVADGTETANAATGSHVVCDNAGNCATAGPIAGNKVDRKAPTVTLTSPTATAYALNQTVTAVFGCTDSGSGVDTCIGTVANGIAINTGTPGSHSFSVTATDAAGNTATAARTYSVGYNVCVLYDQTKAHKSGSTVPIKLHLCDAAGANVSSAATPLTATAVYLISTNAPGSLEDSGNANPDYQFRFDVDKYIFNLSLKGFGQGTYALVFTAAGDPTPQTVTFQVK